MFAADTALVTDIAVAMLNPNIQAGWTGLILLHKQFAIVLAIGFGKGGWTLRGCFALQFFLRFKLLAGFFNFLCMITVL